MTPTRTRKPDFFLAGAPKAGTTAMASWLRAHPAVFFSDPKEPFFWCDEFKELARRERIEDLDTYLGLFADAGDRHLAVGEGSTLYLYSESAIRKIMSFNPGARVVVILRNPSELAHAFHMQMVFHFFEDETDFRTAWELQDERRRGRHLPAGCPVPGLLQYRQVAELGRQVERLSEVVPERQLLLAFFDDLKEDAGAVYRSVLEFLGVPDDGRGSFPRENPAMVARSRRVAALLRHPRTRVLTRRLKAVLPPRMTDVGRRMKAGFMRRNRPREPLDAELSRKLLEEFHDDICKLEALTGRDLSAWKRLQTTGS